MTRWMVALVVGLAACGGEEDGGSATSENCTTEWECENGVCQCADGTPCADEDACDVDCEVCE